MNNTSKTSNQWYTSPKSLVDLLNDLNKVGFKTSVIVTEKDIFLTITKKPDKER